MEWISIKDKIPDGEVLCLNKQGYYLIGYIGVMEDMTVFAENDDQRMLYVTHWMPLPEPPKK